MTYLTCINIRLLDLEKAVGKRLAFLDSYAWHKKIWDCFPGASDQKRDFLSRTDDLEGAIRIWILSARQPTWPPWCPDGSFSTKKISDTFLTHKHYIFDIKVNPIITITQKENDSDSPQMRKNGKHTLNKRVPIMAKNDLRIWIDRKAEQNGFTVSKIRPLEIGPVAEIRFNKKNSKGERNSGCHASVVFRGALEVTDREKFIKAYVSGIGSAKAFGFGLLLLAPLKS